MKMMNLSLNKLFNFNLQFLLFIFAGLLAAIMNFSSRILLSHYLSFSYAIVTAYLIGMTSGFLLFKIFIFKNSHNKTSVEIIFFVSINILGLFQTLLVSLLFLDIIFKHFIVNVHVKEAASHFIGIASTIFTSYLGHKYFTFRSRAQA